MLGNIDELNVEVNRAQTEMAKKDQALAIIRGLAPGVG